MIYLGFNISWPWFKYSDELSKDYFYRYWSVTKYKTFEIQISRGGNTIVGGSFRWDMKCDHAGIMIDLSLFRRFFHVTFHDNRHWDYKNNCWEIYEDE